METAVWRHSPHGFTVRLNVRERLTFDHVPGRIREYGYEVWQNGQLRYWYDSQPHPDDPKLAETHPHHKHVDPDIKRHRIPPPGLSFQGPNIPFLLEEIAALGDGN